MNEVTQQNTNALNLQYIFEIVNSDEYQDLEFDDSQKLNEYTMKVLFEKVDEKDVNAYFWIITDPCRFIYNNKWLDFVVMNNWFNTDISINNETKIIIALADIVIYHFTYKIDGCCFYQKVYIDLLEYLLDLYRNNKLEEFDMMELWTEYKNVKTKFNKILKSYN